MYFFSVVACFLPPAALFESREREMSRQTLAEQLAQIANPTPVDFDPEDSYSTYAQERPAPPSDLLLGRSEYLDITSVFIPAHSVAESLNCNIFWSDRESKLRKKGEAVYDAKYTGRKGSRKDLYDVQDEEDSEDEEMDDFEDLEGEPSAFPPSDEDDDNDDDDDEEDDVESEEEAVQIPTPKLKKSSRSSSTIKPRRTTVEEDEKAMMNQMKLAASSEIEKGRDVKKQLVRHFVVHALWIEPDRCDDVGILR